MTKKKIKYYTLKAKNQNDFPFLFILEFWKLGPKYYAIIEYFGNYASIQFNDLLHAIITIQMLKELDGFYLGEENPFWSLGLEDSSPVLKKVFNCKRKIMNEPLLKRYLKDTWTEIKRRI